MDRGGLDACLRRLKLQARPSWRYRVEHDSYRLSSYRPETPDVRVLRNPKVGFHIGNDGVENAPQ